MWWSIIVVESFPCHQNQCRKCPKINSKWMRMTFTWPRSDFAWEKDLVLRMIAFQHLRFLQIIETLKSAIFQPSCPASLFLRATPTTWSRLLPWNSGFWMGFSHLCFFVCLASRGSSVFTVFENHPKCLILVFQFCHFPPIFVNLKLKM